MACFKRVHSSQNILTKTLSSWLSEFCKSRFVVLYVGTGLNGWLLAPSAHSAAWQFSDYGLQLFSAYQTIFESAHMQKVPDITDVLFLATKNIYTNNEMPSTSPGSAYTVCRTINHNKGRHSGKLMYKVPEPINLNAFISEK